MFRFYRISRREWMRIIHSLLVVTAAVASGCAGGGPPPPRGGGPRTGRDSVAAPADTTVEEHLRIARRMADNGRGPEAIAHLEYTARRFPGSSAVPTQAGLMLLDAGRDEDARRQFRRAIDIGGPDSERAHRELGRVLFDGGEYGEAEEVLLSYNERFPGNFRANMELAFIYFDGGRYREALPFYRGAIEANPESIDARVGLARSLEQLGRLDNAIRVYDDALGIRELTRELEPVMIAQANLLNKRGRYEDTLELLQRARFPETPGLACARGLALAGLGRYNDAITAFTAASVDARWGDFANEQIRRIRNTTRSN